MAIKSAVIITLLSAYETYFSTGHDDDSIMVSNLIFATKLSKSVPLSVIIQVKLEYLHPMNIYIEYLHPTALFKLC